MSGKQDASVAVSLS